MSAHDQHAFSKEDLVASGHGTLFGEGFAQLPKDNMLMVDRVINMTKDGGENGKGEIIAELDINPDLWFFDCHFQGDPVMPGCLGLDAMWQLVGFYLGAAIKVVVARWALEKLNSPGRFFPMQKKSLIT